MDDLDQLVQTAQADFDAAPGPAELENAKARYLGKAGRLTEMLKGLGALAPDEKKARGADINRAKQRVEALLTAARDRLAEAELERQLRAEALDVTLPGRQRGKGGLHPVSRTMERIEAIFASMGFDVADGPEIETDWMSFTALNNPENHPARSMQDTFYVDLKDSEGRWLNLRPHTSPMQVRYARAHAASHAHREAMPEIRVIAPGRTYRVDSDATHSPMFHQCEGLWIGENVSFKDLKAVFSDFLRQFFETDDLDVRFRPSFFPFTEPSVEVDFSCHVCAGDGCRVCKQSGWIEILGAGMVDPEVFKAVGYDPEQVTGYAFGMGIERIAMILFGIEDIRNLYENDVRFLSQFG